MVVEVSVVVVRSFCAAAKEALPAKRATRLEERILAKCKLLKRCTRGGLRVCLDSGEFVNVSD